MLNFNAFELVDEFPPGKHVYDWFGFGEVTTLFASFCLRERQTRFSSSICLLAKAASCKDFGLHVVDISVAFVHARTDEEIYVKVPSGIESSKFWRLKAAVNGMRKA